MAHTLNELVRTKTPATSTASASAQDDFINFYLTSLVELTGWTRGTGDEINYFYIGKPSNKNYLVFTKPNSVSQVYVYAYLQNISIGYAILNYTVTGAPVNVVRVHASSDEKVVYFNIGNSGDLSFVYAINPDNEEVIYKKKSNTELYCSYENCSTLGVIGIGANNNQNRYSVAKFVDNFSINGGFFPELYWVYSTVSPSINNQLVQFNTEKGPVIMRLVSPFYTVATELFAFPVSDSPSEPEQNESTP